MNIVNRSFEQLKEVDTAFNLPYLSEIINYCVDKSIPLNLVEISSPITNFYVGGLATPNGVFLNKEITDFFTSTIFYSPKKYYLLVFTTLHEIGHYLRLRKSQEMEIDLNADYQIFFDRSILEEGIANRFASRMFYQLVGRDCDEFNEINNALYANPTKMNQIYHLIFNDIKQSGLSYFEYIQSQIKQ